MSKEFQPPRRKNRTLMRVGAAVASLGLALPACGTSGSSENSINTVPGVAKTTIPSTTIELPTTTLEPKPTDVVEHRDGYDVLRNGGLLTKVESINVEGVEIDTSWFGGFETHIESLNVTFGMRNDEKSGSQLLLTDILRAFGNQHVDENGKPLFVKVDGQVDIQAYLSYLESNNWVDPEVYVPDNTAEGPAAFDEITVVQSKRLKLDFSKPFIMSNNSLSLIEGFEPDNANVFEPTPDRSNRTSFGINDDGQLFYGSYSINSDNIIKELRMEHPYLSYPMADKLGFFLQLTNRITHSDSNLWEDTFIFYNDPNMIVKSEKKAPYPVISIFDFIGYEAGGTINRLFVPVES